MHFRVAAGICVILSVLVILPVLALPDISQVTTSSRTGQVWVTLKNINGTEAPERVAVAYAVGEVSEIPAHAVLENAGTGFVTITAVDTLPSQNFMFTSSQSALNAAPPAESSYFINTVTVGRTDEPMLVNNANFAVVPATANYYADLVPEGKQHEWIDVDWKDPSKDISLMVYAPDAVFGPYTDVADGRKDGRIFLDVGSSQNVTPGYWFFRVQSSLQDRIHYSLNTYSA